jgi:hypothetical protein
MSRGSEDSPPSSTFSKSKKITFIQTGEYNCILILNYIITAPPVPYLPYDTIRQNVAVKLYISSCTIDIGYLPVVTNIGRGQDVNMKTTLGISAVQ